MGDQWEQGRRGKTGGPMRWGANENRITRITLGDQWDGGPVRAGWESLHGWTNEMGDQWEPYNQDILGDQWELYNQGYIGGPMRWLDQWEQGRKGYKGGGGEAMGWGANESCVTRITLGGQWDGGPGFEIKGSGGAKCSLIDPKCS